MSTQTSGTTQKEWLTTLTLGVMLAMSGFAGAQMLQEFPQRPVRMIVPLAPGGGSDIVGRMVAAALSDEWRQTVVVDNRPGAGSTVGTGIAAKATPDGYTLMVSSSSMAITPALHKQLDFHILRDFSPVSLLASQPSILAVHPSLKAGSLKELVALAKASPGQLRFASAGPASATHLGTELFLHAAGIRMLHVPYKSAGQATTALLSGETQVLLTNMASMLPHVKSGRVRAIGVSSTRRSNLAKDLPTLAEAGLAGFEYATWYGMVAPRGVPGPVLGRIHSAVSRSMSKPTLEQRFSRQGLTVYASTPEDFHRYLTDEVAKWERVVKAAGISLK
jgi:tripartite-type tricarboxylate transporter receptor subunit TctC